MLPYMPYRIPSNPSDKLVIKLLKSLVRGLYLKQYFYIMNKNTIILKKYNSPWLMVRYELLHHATSPMKYGGHRPANERLPFEGSLVS